MLLIKCPVCGIRDHTEFNYGGDATAARPGIENRETEPWLQYVFMRSNPCGWHREYWHHVLGCRSWLVVERNTRTHEIRDVCLAHAAQRQGNDEGMNDVRPEE